jgi:hypothetical protein
MTMVLNRLLLTIAMMVEMMEAVAEVETENNHGTIAVPVHLVHSLVKVVTHMPPKTRITEYDVLPGQIQQALIRGEAKVGRTHSYLLKV